MMVTTGSDAEVDTDGFSSCQARIQLGSADEFTLTIPARDHDNKWRSDMVAFQVGATLKLWLGWDDYIDVAQKFEIVGVDESYDDDDESLTIRGASGLVKALRNRNGRVFKGGSDMDVISQICSDHGWTNAVSGPLADPKIRTKEAGKTDLDILRTIALEAQLGAPRLDRNGRLVMPRPTANDALVVSRGSLDDPRDVYPLDSFKPSREGGQSSLKVRVRGFDPASGKFVETTFEANEFGGDPQIINRKEFDSLDGESSTTGLVLQVVEQESGSAKNSDRVEVLSSGRYRDEQNAADLAARWFEARERFSRSADINLAGTDYLFDPYQAIKVVGDLPATTLGYWLPLNITHEVGDDGWTASARCIRIVDKSSIKTGG